MDLHHLLLAGLPAHYFKFRLVRRPQIGLTLPITFAELGLHDFNGVFSVQEILISMRDLREGSCERSIKVKISIAL
jgi:hypothetical protein